jgi:hypothetical protein
LLLTKTRIQGCTMLGSKAMHLQILARVWEASPEVEVLQHIEHVEILLNLIRSFLLLVILEAVNHGEAMEHVGVGEIVDIEGE